MSDSPSFKLGFIGAGNMAEAIARGVISASVLGAAELVAADPIEDRRRVFSEELGVRVSLDNREIIGESQAVLLAVKPQECSSVLAEIAPHLGSGQLMISIMAGVGSNSIASQLGGEVRVVRVMPNLLIAVGAGIAGIARGKHATDEDVEFARRIFDTAGTSIVLDEPHLDAVTAVSGSGPAYFFYFVEAITEGGVRAGLTREHADLLAKHTALGAAKMMLERSEPPAELRAKVTSKGGTTHAAIESMNNFGVAEAIADGVVAAWRRSKELGQ
jgi:pyrroline-5-carboxylate reductase